MTESIICAIDIHRQAMKFVLMPTYNIHAVYIQLRLLTITALQIDVKYA